jgi:outer membrane protein
MMKAARVILTIALSALFTMSVQAESKIGLIDMRAALFSSTAAQNFSDKMVEEFKQQDLEVRSVGEAAKKLETRLQNDAAIMSDSERAKLSSDLEEKIQEYKYLKTRLDKALAEKRQQFLEESRPKLDKVINDLVEQESLELLLPREAALYAAEGMDYTQKVITMLNDIK